MLAGLSIVLTVAAAQAAVTGQAQAPAAKPAEKADACAPPSADSTTIVICTQRPQGYRLNPDVMEAKRETRSPGRPVRPGGAPRPDCATVGPQRCAIAGVDIVAAVLTAAEMAKRVAKGQEIGSMFLTDPHPDEYHLYLMAKARREAEDAQKAAAAKSKAAAAAAPPAPPAQTRGN